MSVARFSDEQRAAFECRDGALALAANAGSGKTSVLVERFVRAVTEDAISPGRILAITFTDRAAGELRARVRAGLVAAGRRDAAGAAATSFISTFHAFAVRILRAHPLLAGLPPDFAVLDELQASELREQAFELAFAAWLEREGALELAATFGFEQLRPAIFAIYEECRSRGEAAPSLPAPSPGADVAVARSAFARTRDEVAAELAHAAPTASVERALARLERCRRLLAVAEPPSPAALATVALGGHGKALDTPAADAYEDARLAYEGALADRLATAAVPLLDALLRELGERFAALKAARGAADFDDLELRALALLSDHGDVARAWRERFERTMVDELQDTNPRQMALLALIARDNLFTVGDEFQSIYAFRHADVAIFRERFAQLAPAGRALVLSASYRSRATLIDAVNAVFAPRFGPAFVPLRAGREDAAGGPPVELLLTDCDGWEDHAELLGGEQHAAPLWRRAEARLLAARLDELIADGAAEPGEIVVLLRAATAADVYEAALRERGYAALTPSGEGFYARPEIVDLVAYVQALANPLDELALYGLLASPLCGADADGLVALALAAREGAGTVWAALDAASDPRLAAFAERFAQARRASSSCSLGAIVATAIEDHGYELYLAQLPSPERRIANVRKLVRLARDYERREGRDLRRFADALSAGRAGGLREAEAPPPVADAIRLMTIHAAKGLEFPVVCLADLGHRPNHSLPRLLTDGARVGLRLPSIERARPHETLDYAALRAERRAADAAEERRLYYVAMTRARERLILSGAARFAGWPREDGPAIAWLAPALVPDLGERLAAPAPAPAIVAGAEGVAVRLTLSSAAAGAELLTGPATPGTPPPIPAQPIRPVELPPAARAAPAQPGSLSYTSLAEYERCGYRYYLQRVTGLADVPAPPAPDASAIAAAPRGVLVHALLERIDFADPKPPDAAAVASVAAAGGLALAPADAAEIGELAHAIAASPLCARLAGARELRRELPFVLTLDGQLLRGVIDVCGIEPDGTLLIVDYKTDRLDDGADLAARIERDYSLQRLVYALAGLRAGAPRVEVAHCFLRAPQTPVGAVFEAGLTARLETELRARLEPLRAGRFEVAPEPGYQRCATCPGRARLCSYDVALTLRIAV